MIKYKDYFYTKSSETNRKKVKEELNISLLFNACKALGFDMSKDRKQSVFILRYDPDNKSYYPSWKQLSKEELENGEKRGTFERNNTEYPIIKYWNWNEKVFKDHFYPVESSNKTPLKFLMNEKNYDLAVQARYYHNKMIGVTEHKIAKTVCFDIDNKVGNNEKAINTLKALIKEMDYKIPIHLEIQGKTHASHIFYRLDEYFSEQDSKDFVEIFNNKYKEQGYKIETRYKTRIFRLPCSASYIPLKIEDKQDLENLDINKRYDNLMEWAEHIINFRANIEYAEFLDMIDAVEKTPVPVLESKRELNWIKGRANKKECSKMQQEYSSNLRHILCNNYPIVAGDRINTMFKIASFCIRYGFNEEDFLEACLSNNVSSKDFAKWSDERIRKECFKFFKWCQEKNWQNVHIEHFVHKEYKKPAGFISNIDKIPENLLNICEDFSTSFYKYSIEPFIKYKKWKSEYKKATNILLKEIIGYFLYNRKNEKYYNPKSYMTFAKFEDITHRDNIQIPRIMLDRLKKHYKLKIDIHNLFNKIMKSDLFNQIYLSDKGWNYNDLHSYCRIFRFKNFKYNLTLINNIISNLKNTINNIIKYIYSYKDKKLYYIILKLLNINNSGNEGFIWSYEDTS